MTNANNNNTDTTNAFDQQLAKAKDCADIIRFRPHGEKYEKPYQQARVEPNQRLVEVFGIDNAFTNVSNDVRSRFRGNTIQKMRAATKIDKFPQGNWTDLQQRATAYFEEYLGRNGDTVNLPDLVQFVTLKVSLCYLFADANEALGSGDRFEDIEVIGHSINKLWIDSKKPDGQRPMWVDQTKLHEALRRVTTIPQMMGSFPLENIADPTEPSSNPMNLLLPAYETMWRVVVRCFLEIKYRGAADGASWARIMEEYLEVLKNPKSAHGEAFHKSSPQGVRPVDIAKEALRLYPPTRRVHRIFYDKIYRADIEACQREELLGKDDPLVFRPERWQDMCPELRRDTYNEVAKVEKKLKDTEEKLGYMPFAFWCAADLTETKEFGVKMVALLVAVLCAGLQNDWVVDDDVTFPPSGTPLETDREAYEGLVLKKWHDATENGEVM